MSSAATVQIRAQNQPSKERKPYRKPLIEERPMSEFSEKVSQCRRVISYCIKRKIGEANAVGLEYGDLEDAAFEGVFKSWIKHDPDIGRMETYASYKIRGELTKTINKAYALRGSHNRFVWIIRGYEEALRIYEGTQKGLPRTNIAVDVLDKLESGQLTGDDVEEKLSIAKMRLHRRTGCFLEDRVRGVNDDEGLTVMSHVERKIAEEWEEPDMEWEDVKGSLWEALNSLNEREKDVIIRRHLEGEETLQKIGEEWNVSRERVRQIESKAFRKLKTVLKSDPLVRSYMMPELL